MKYKSNIRFYHHKLCVTYLVSYFYKTTFVVSHEKDDFIHILHHYFNHRRIYGPELMVGGRD